MSGFYRGPGGTGDATGDASSQAALAIQKAAQASASAAAAETSATAAGNSATAAAASSTNADTQATNAASSASNAATSATAAASSATSAASSATTATTKAVEAATSATNASNNATAASSSATSASSSASSAASSASGAASYASTATTKASEAATSATDAASSATAAASSATSANSSASSAANSATSASTSASAASTSATNAASSATSASTSASTATTQATNASNSASSAATSATSAGNSATSASNSATSASASLTSFKGQYYGNLTADPTLDPNGNSVGAGDLYYNTSLNVMKVYNAASGTWSAVQTGITNVEADRHSIRPSLLLDFANTKALDPRITFARASTASYFNVNGVMQTAAAATARFDHNPVTGESLGLLIEEARTNLVLQSQFASGWSATRSTLSANQAIAPDGTLTGAKLIDDTSANSHFISQTATIANVTAHTFTFYAKAGGRSWVTLWVTNIGTVSNTYFDLQNGVLGAVPGGVTATIAAVGNGWYRCSVTGTSTSTSTIAYIGTATANGINTAAGDGLSGIYIWGAQLEAGSFATSYIPTVASQVTRAADAASMTGTNFSSWYRADEGSFYSEYLMLGLNSSLVNAVADISDGTSNNRITYYRDTSSLAFSVRVGNVVQAGLASGTASINTSLKQAGAYKVNDFAFSANGGTPQTDISGTVPIVSTMVIGNLSYVSNGYQVNGTIKKLAYYPKRLTNAELQGLTTA